MDPNLTNNQNNKADIVILTERRYESTDAPPDDWYYKNILQDEQMLQDALQKIGISSVRLDWSRKDVDWAQYKCLVFRTVWDYVERIDEFNEWFDSVNKVTKLCNSYSLIKWNMDKHYLKDLEQKGISIVPTRFVEKGSILDIEKELLLPGWEEMVIKPCVSSTARHTYRVNKYNIADIEALINNLLKDEAFMYQPFMESVLTKGEDTLMLFNGKYSHAIQKLPKPGDFRVQDDFGGTVYDHQPSAEQIAFAERVMAACHEVPVYGRVDIVKNNQGEFAVMELEILDPELWIRKSNQSAELFADSISTFLKQNE